jgi:Uma2 family endonuclease
MHASRQHEVVYPSSDGKPMSDNTLQYEWIVTIKGGLDARLPDFVAGDLLWYPVRGRPDVRIGPDVLVALGRPKGHRSSYRQWDEAGVAPQVVFEILSPGNTLPEMVRKRGFYETHGVQEYYVYNPDTDHLDVWVRRGGALEEVAEVDGWVSPLTGVRFVFEASGLTLYGADGRRFESFQEQAARLLAFEVEVEAERQRAEAERQRAEAKSREAASAQAETEAARQDAAAANTRAERLAARLRALGIDAE